ncbi:ATP-dependent protease [candidate division TA06 bacterium SM1_40]|uniref:endopeptidase La n=1 Tax=candidate division TA06 bacterium SM1_40 TaxID=1703773 RepID=A0A0S8JP86_UNCT6|nr:MAG: ATP-dependent protease [candidate division TA06 bacterium SM1_40]
MSVDLTRFEVPVENLCWICPDEHFPFETTDDLSASYEIIGQDRAVRAIELGLNIESVGYNIFITGLVGTGRNTTIKLLLDGIEKDRPTPDDKCYVHNFRYPDMPKVISLPAGKGTVLVKAMDDLLDRIPAHLRALLESEEFQERRKAVAERFQKKQRELIEEFDKKVKADGFTLVQVQVGTFTRPDLVPVVDGEPVDPAQLEALVEQGKFPRDRFDALKERYRELAEELAQTYKQTTALEREARSALESLTHETVAPLIDHLLEEIKEKVPSKEVFAHLDEVKQSVLDNLERFSTGAEPTAEAEPLPPEADPFLEYRVNLIIDNSRTSGPPIVFENSPSYKNLFGTIERVTDRSGQWRTDFTRIRAGSFVRANGGFLIVNALDALTEPGVWVALKRALRNRTVEIQSYDPFYMFTTSALKPEAIECDTKVIMIGDPGLYQLLYENDHDFRKIFKIKADFDSVMPQTMDSIMQYARFIKKICDDEGLLPFDKTGVGAVVEYGSRLAGKQSKLSTWFTYIADVLREATYWARQQKSTVVRFEHVDHAIQERIKRLNLVEEKIQEMIDEGSIMIDTEGRIVGQVNGLSVYLMGDHAFGKPSRITAQIAMGRSGIIDIEREAELGGRTHNKGVLILSGYLRGKYAQDKPLAISASLCFEQSYSDIDGDSASSSELYALLSSISGIPLRQDIAVTGSVNQKGEIQPIGSVNHKIEGFFDVCKTRGLTSTQGVMIPHQNMKDLMLRRDVIEAVREKKFHIYAVKTIDEGIELLTGMPAGERGEDGTYPEKTINRLVDDRLTKLVTGLKQFGGEAEETHSE